MIKVYGFPNSRSLRITWLLEELGLDYQYQLIDFSKSDHRASAFLAINPGGKVPVIEDAALVMSESAAIVTYLADKYGNNAVIPAAGTASRGLYEQWSYFAVCELEQPLWMLAKHKFALPEAHRVKEIFATAGWEYQKALALLSQGLGDQEYLLGEGFTAVDILIAHTLQWGVKSGQPLEQANLDAYRQRLQARPARVKALARETEALAG
ncbi:MAG: glutathione S-transferase [Motiliproteus sp.]|jgi:glutathione S-transferase